MKNLSLLCLLIAACQFLYAQDIIDSIPSQGEVREFRVHLPNNTEPTTPVPLVIAMHGLGDNMNNFSGVGFSQLGDAENFIAVYPQGAQLPILGSGWRIGTPLDGNVSDVQFIAELIDTLVSRHLIDTDRIYTTGFSMGSFMSHIIGCALSDRIAAIAGHSGTYPAATLNNCNPVRRVPAMHFHGTSDQVIAYNGGTFSGVYNYASAQQIVERWATVDSCVGAIDSIRLPNTGTDGTSLTIDKFEYTDCADSTEVIHYRINGLQHTWIFTPTNDLDATEEMWEFFSRHSLDGFIDTTGTTDTTTTNDTTTNNDSTNTALLTIDTDELIAVYPNPSTGQFVIAANAALNANIKVYNITGQVVFEKATTENQLIVDLSKEADGLYLLHIVDNNGNMLTRKQLLKQ